MTTEKSKTKRWKLWIGGALVTGVLFYAVAVPKSVMVQTARVSRGTFDETIQTDGILRSKERQTVTAFAVGDVKRMPLKVGDPVKKGQVITELAWDAEYRPVRAPSDGVISKVYRESAGPIQRGDPIVEIVDPHRLEVVASLLTTDAMKVSVGDTAWIKDIGGDGGFEAKVFRISKAGYVKQSALGVEEERTEVLMEPDEKATKSLENLGDTFHVDMVIRISTEPNALKLPIGAVFRDGEGWSTYAVEKDRARKRPLKVLKRNSEEVMIAEDLPVDTVVILYPGDLVKDGTKVKVSEAP